LNGTILRIERLSCYDGNGLRTVVFLKGCPLRCRWCSTPESHQTHTDFGVHSEICTHCFACHESCPPNAISYDDVTSVFTTDISRCDDCGKCIEKCLPGARRPYGFTASVDDIVNEVEKDSLFYMHSRGGVTVSGGEPFMQTEFLYEILKRCMMIGINTAIETSGYTQWENLSKILPVVDTLFYDLKHMNDEIHQKITGVSNKLIHSNLLKLDGLAPRHLSLIVRMPVIPTINDSDENIISMGKFCLKLKKLIEIQLLPYHRLGMETYRRLSIPYPVAQIKPNNPGDLEHKALLLNNMGLRTIIGS